MKQDSTIGILTGVLALSALASAILLVLFYTHSRSLHSLQTQYFGINTHLQRVNALASDCVEYSKKNAAIDPLLIEIGVKPKNATATPAAAKPATK
jgi:hypothetical protein